VLSLGFLGSGFISIILNFSGQNVTGTHLLFGSVGLLLELPSKSVELVHLILNLLLQSLLKSRTYNPQHEGLDQAEQNLMFGLLELDIEVLDINVNFIHLKEILAIMFLSCRHLHLEAEACSTKENVGETLVSDAGDAVLSFDIVGHIP
jgi:hypothetical protein